MRVGYQKFTELVDELLVGTAKGKGYGDDLFEFVKNNVTDGHGEAEIVYNRVGVPCLAVEPLEERRLYGN
jgi:hypothetical protein